MKIKYVWFSEPEKEKILDTLEARRKMPHFERDENGNWQPSTMSQDEYDERTLAGMERDKISGRVLSYEVVEEVQS